MNAKRCKVAAGGEKFIVGNNEVVSLKEEEFPVRKTEARGGQGCGLAEAKGEKVLLLLAPKGQRVKHARALTFEVTQVAGPENVQKGMRGEALRRENVDHVVGGRENVAADRLTRGVKKAPEEEASNGEAPLELERAKGFNGDDQMQARVDDDLRGKGKEVGAGVLEKGTISLAVGVSLVGVEVGVLPGIILQNAPTSPAKIKVKERQQDLGLLFADKNDVKVRVRDDNVIVRRVTADVGGRGELWCAIKARGKGEIGDRTDGTEAEFPEARDVILQRNVRHNNAGAD